MGRALTFYVKISLPYTLIVISCFTNLHLSDSTDRWMVSSGHPADMRRNSRPVHFPGETATGSARFRRSAESGPRPAVRQWTRIYCAAFISLAAATFIIVHHRLTGFAVIELSFANCREFHFVKEAVTLYPAAFSRR